MAARHPLVQPLLSLTPLLRLPSRWIIGSDAWSYDIGSSGIHHLIASGLNVNILILDATPYSVRNTVDPHPRKKDIGLYATNHGDVYVASVAVYSSYSQVLQALIEADRFDGPSVVLVHLPYSTEETSVLEILKETKLAVDAGYWPLYRQTEPCERAGGQGSFHPGFWNRQERPPAVLGSLEVTSPNSQCLNPNSFRSSSAAWARR